MPCCSIASHIADSAIAELLHCPCSQVPATNSRLLVVRQSNAKQGNANQSNESKAKQS
jgi:hypothetical protein